MNDQIAMRHCIKGYQQFGLSRSFRANDIVNSRDGSCGARARGGVKTSRLLTSRQSRLPKPPWMSCRSGIRPPRPPSRRPCPRRPCRRRVLPGARAVSVQEELRPVGAGAALAMGDASPSCFRTKFSSSERGWTCLRYRCSCKVAALAHEPEDHAVEGRPCSRNPSPWCRRAEVLARLGHDVAAESMTILPAARRRSRCRRSLELILAASMVRCP